MTQVARAGQVVDEFDRPVPGASIYVYNIDGTDASITSDGISPITQPLSTDEFGNYGYYAETNYYREDTWYGGKLRYRETGAIGNPGADLFLRSDLAAVTGAALVGIAQSGTLQTQIDKINSRSLGILSTGGTIPLSIATDFTAAPDGTTDFRGVLFQAQLNGANSAAQINAQNIQVELDHAVGKTVTVTHGIESYIRLGLQKSAVGNVTSARVYEGHVANESLGSTIASAFVYYVNDTDYADDIAGAAGTITTMVGMGVGNIGHATKNTNAYQFYGANCTASPGVTATFYSEMAGAGKWVLYGQGNSPSALLGALSLGKTTAPAEVLDVHGNATVDGFYKCVGVQVVGPRQTGWTADTGTAKKTANASYAAGTTLTYSASYVQAEQTAMATRMAAVEAALQSVTQAQKAIKDALIAHGLIGT